MIADDIQRDALEGNQARTLLGVGTPRLPDIRFATELHKRTSSSPNYQIYSGRCVSVLLLHSNPSEAMLSLRRIGILDRFAHIGILASSACADAMNIAFASACLVFVV